MTQPHGFVDSQFSSYVCKLNKALHALLQWGFQALRVNSSMFFQHSATDVLILLVYVDDFSVTGSNSSQVSSFISYLNSTFAICDLRRLNNFLGIEAPPIMVCNCTKLTPLIFKGIQMQIGPLAQMTIGLCLSPSAPPLVWCDNQSATHLAANLVFHARSKHIELDLHFIRDHVLRKNLSIHYIPTYDQINKALHCSSPYELEIEYTQVLALPNETNQELTS
ncbi:hypothetical protein AAG906_013532 [Vitis piasezkii]